MSSYRASLGLLLLLGVVFASAGPVQYVSVNLLGTHELITKELDLEQSEIGSNPLFGSVIRSINMSCQRRDDIQVMNATLDVYMRIFSSILQQNHHRHHQGRTGLLDQLSSAMRPEVVSAVRKQQQLMEKLKSHLNGQLHHNKEELLNKLSKIKVDDPVVQKKALAEYLQIYQAASVIGSWSC